MHWSYCSLALSHWHDEHVICNDMIICMYHDLLNPIGAESRIFRDNKINSMAADALAPSLTKASADMLLTHWGLVTPYGDIDLGQSWLIINGVLWYLPYNNFTGSAWDTSSWYEFENNNFEIMATSPRGQWVKCAGWMDHYHPWTWISSTCIISMLRNYKKCK